MNRVSTHRALALYSDLSKIMLYACVAAGGFTACATLLRCLCNHTSFLSCHVQWPCWMDWTPRRTHPCSLHNLVSPFVITGYACQCARVLTHTLRNSTSGCTAPQSCSDGCHGSSHPPDMHMYKSRSCSMFILINMVYIEQETQRDKSSKGQLFHS